VILYSAGKTKESGAAFDQVMQIAQQIRDQKTEAQPLSDRCGMLLSGGRA
jgi:hypothetical protein